MLTQLINARILTPQGWLKDGSVLIRDGKILEVTNCDLAVIGTVEEDRVGNMLVVPYFMWVWTAPRKASSVHSIKSRPPTPCAWISTPPGSTYTSRI